MSIVIALLFCAVGCFATAGMILTLGFCRAGRQQKELL